MYYIYHCGIHARCKSNLISLKIETVDYVNESRVTQTQE
jgi:hypothetical protein